METTHNDTIAHFFCVEDTDLGPKVDHAVRNEGKTLAALLGIVGSDAGEQDQDESDEVGQTVEAPPTRGEDHQPADDGGPGDFPVGAEVEPSQAD